MLEAIMVPVVCGLFIGGFLKLFELFVCKKERLALIEKMGDRFEKTNFWFTPPVGIVMTDEWTKKPSEEVEAIYASATDVAIDAGLLQKDLSEIVKITYNCLSVDGDTSTYDMLTVMANGLAENEKIVSANEDYLVFKAALYEVLMNLTKMLAKDGEGGAEIYSVATKRDQSKIVWEESKKMIKKSPCLAKRIRCLIGGIYYDATDSSFRALASDSNSLDGLNAHLVIADEVHAWKDKNLLDVMYDSMSARQQPLLLETSTMGTIRQNVFDIEYDYASQVVDGTIQDEVLLPVIYELDEEKEWVDENSWYKANPALGTIKDLKSLREKVERAKNNPIELVNLLCKDFNVRQNSINAWLTFDDLNNEEIYQEWKDCYCIGGCDH